jgi:hypothetical protein
MDPKAFEFKTGPTPARYVVLAVVDRHKPGKFAAVHLMQQRVHHKLYSAPSYSYVNGMRARLDQAQRGGWGGRE